MNKRLGNVYWVNSQKIDRSDRKRRRQYAIVRDNGKNVGVSKIRGFNGNKKNDERLFELSKDKYPLSKRSGVDKKVYSQRVDNHKSLRLEDNEVFDKKPSYKLNSHDTHRVLKHTGYFNNKKGRK